jgi:hypothetical protein
MIVCISQRKGLDANHKLPNSVILRRYQCKFKFSTMCVCVGGLGGGKYHQKGWVCIFPFWVTVRSRSRRISDSGSHRSTLDEKSEKHENQARKPKEGRKEPRSPRRDYMHTYVHMHMRMHTHQRCYCTVYYFAMKIWMYLAPCCWQRGRAGWLSRAHVWKPGVIRQSGPESPHEIR